MDEERAQAIIDEAFRRSRENRRTVSIEIVATDGSAELVLLTACASVVLRTRSGRPLTVGVLRAMLVASTAASRIRR